MNEIRIKWRGKSCAARARALTTHSRRRNKKSIIHTSPHNNNSNFVWNSHSTKYDVQMAGLNDPYMMLKRGKTSWKVEDRYQFCGVYAIIIYLFAAINMFIE